MQVQRVDILLEMVLSAADKADKTDESSERRFIIAEALAQISEVRERAPRPEPRRLCPTRRTRLCCHATSSPHRPAVCLAAFLYVHVIGERVRCGATQVDPLLKRLTAAWNDSSEHIMAGTLKGGCARAAVTSVRICCACLPICLSVCLSPFLPVSVPMRASVSVSVYECVAVLLVACACARGPSCTHT